MSWTVKGSTDVYSSSKVPQGIGLKTRKEEKTTNEKRRWKEMMKSGKINDQKGRKLAKKRWHWKGFIRRLRIICWWKNENMTKR